MTASLSTEQILALAPDASSAKSGRDLANARKWVSLGRNGAAAWGECQGSGAQPYRTQIDLGEPAFRCTCPSRKFPCKHGLGLFLLLADQPAVFRENAPPDWVASWLESRAKRAQQAQGPKKSEAKQVSASSRSAERRESRVAEGLAELETWLRDLARNGLASVQAQPYSFWERPAARLVDAQAPGAARFLRQMAGAAQSGEGWADRLLESMARAHLLVEGYKRLGELPPDTQADIRTLVGWTQSQEEVLAGEGVRDRWLVLGQRVEEEDRLRVKRTWLWGEQSGQAALVLHFAHAKQPLDASLVPGTMFDATLAFFPGSHPKRALVKERHDAPSPFRSIPGHTLMAAIEQYAEALAANPWIERFPMALRGVTPQRVGDGWVWVVRDEQGHVLPLSPQFDGSRQLLALSGGYPVAVFGEWNGRHLLPLSAWAGGLVQL